ncbi:MAG: hypothetical protein WD770_04630 [Actinomycetota bacterium]
MPRDWITIRVDLLSGHGEDLEPSPGRIMLVGPRHTFADLSQAIDDAFARWDQSHLHVFGLGDGRDIGPPDPDGELDFEDEASVVVASAVKPGEVFRYEFDFGDSWEHRCTVQDAGVDPREAYGETPRRPVPIWGWGRIPDQYGRTEPGLPDA